MAAQLDGLAETAELANVSLRVVPFWSACTTA